MALFDEHFPQFKKDSEVSNSWTNQPLLDVDQNDASGGDVAAHGSLPQCCVGKELNGCIAYCSQR